MMTEVSGATFSGNSARTVISRNNHGNERNKSVPAITKRSIQPPRKPAAPPIVAANKLAISAAVGASNKDTRVPYRTREKRSRPRSSVPSQCSWEAAAFGISRN